MVVETFSSEETYELGREIGRSAKPGEIYTLTGDLGGGKTVFTQGVAAGLDICEPVNSPTFTILQIYEEGRLPFYHFDVYRIADVEEMEEIVLLCDFHEKKQHYDQVFALDGRFHETLYRACKSKILEHLLKDFHQYVQKVRKTSLSTRERAEKSTKEHEDILAAIKERDPGRADELATLHIMNTIRNFRHYKIETILEKQEEEHGQD